MTVRMRHTKGHTANRRSHHALTEVRFSKCADCGADHIRHQACQACGKYRGRLVVDVPAIRERSLKRKQNKLRAIGHPVSHAKDDTADSSK